jgi:hypothetical protein
LTQNFTIATWFRNEYVGATTPDGNRNFVFEGQGDFDVSFGTGSGTSGPDNYASYNTTAHIAHTASLARNAWHHVLHAFSTDGTNTTLQVYVNGSLVATNSSPLTTTMAVNGINFGRNRAAARYLEGGVDEVAIWNQTLSGTEALAVYNAGVNNLGLPNQSFDVGMASSFSMNFDSGTLPIAQGWTVENVAITAGPNNDLGDAGMAGNYARTITSGDNTMTLNLTNLPGHTHVNLGMLMAQLDSMDGFRDNDRFIVKIDGNEILNARVSYGSSTDYSPGPPAVGNIDGPGNVYIEVDGNPALTSELASLTTIATTQLYGGTTFLENVYDLSAFSAFQMIPHTSSTLTLEIIGRQNQAGGEFFGLDNIQVEFVTIPEPSTFAMLAFGAIAMWLFRRGKV